MMFVLTVAVSRAVPLLFLFALILVLGRFLYDRYRTWNRAVARSLFAVVLLLGAAGSSPYVLGSAALVSAELAFSLQRWQQVDRYYHLHARLLGLPSDDLTRNWATALMNLQRWQEAEELLLTTVRIQGQRSVVAPYTLYLLGVSRYYQGRWTACERTLTALEESSFFPLREYLLGRCAERGQRQDEAIRYYLRTLENHPSFFPALYQAVRLLLAQGRVQQARDLLLGFWVDEQTRQQWPLYTILEQSLAQATAVPDREFYFVDLG